MPKGPERGQIPPLVVFFLPMSSVFENRLSDQVTCRGADLSSNRSNWTKSTAGKEKVMQVKLTSRHFELDQGLRTFAEQEISKLKRYFNNIIDAHLILEQEKSRLTAELTVKVYGTTLVAKSNGFEPRSAVEEVTDIMQGRLKKYKAKLQDKKAKGRSVQKRAMRSGGMAWE